MFSNAARPIRLVFITLSAVLAWNSMAQAEVSSDCDAWSFLPDLYCDSRTARPEGTFNPVGMPFLFEDPHITTGLNFAYVLHRLPDDNAFEGGEAHVLALQIRVALTDRLAFIATKDGLTMLRPGNNAPVANATGIFDMTFGFKYALLELPAHNFILTPALRYEIPMGSEKLFQGYGDGVFIPSASFRWGLADIGIEQANLVGTLGGQIPVNSDHNSESLFYAIHFDYGFDVDTMGIEYFVPFLEVTGIHYTQSGDGLNSIHLRGGGQLPLGVAQGALGTGSFEGVDVANIGSTGVAGNDIVVMGAGFRIPTTLGISFGLMYEVPVTSRNDIHDQRFTFMATWEL